MTNHPRHPSALLYRLLKMTMPLVAVALLGSLWPLVAFADSVETDAAYMIINVASQKAIEIESGADWNLANIRIGLPNAGLHQRWRFHPKGFAADDVYDIASIRSGRVLDVRGYSVKNGANVQLFRRYSSKNQQWRLFSKGDGAFTIIAQHSGLCLDTDSEGVDRENVCQSTCNSSRRQQWRLEKIPKDQHPVRIVAKHSGKCLNVSEQSRQNRARVQQQRPHDSMHQVWTLFPVRQKRGSAAYAIISAFSGKALDVSGASNKEQAVIQQYDFHGRGNQLWQLRPVSGGFTEIVSVGSGGCLDVRGKSLADGAIVQQYPCNDGDNQKWQLEPVEIPLLPGSADTRMEEN